MKNYPFSFDQLSKFSNSDPYSFIPAHLRQLKEDLDLRQRQLRFPAIQNDVGSFLAFFLTTLAPKRVFEMGSGYGHSAFWHFVGANHSLERVVLTEKREDLKDVYNALAWPLNWKNRMDYWQGDAFEKLSKERESFDFFLVDGIKADYLDFIQAALKRLSPLGIIAVDNSFWRGSFLNSTIRDRKKSAQKVFEMHEWIKGRQDLQAVFAPFMDGLTLIRKSS
ncbi:MAG: class I SAM-dependent methyltransferase [Bacteriovoracaceae bacterium]